MAELNEILGYSAHPSWYPRVLSVLARDYPDISAEVWEKAVSENAEQQNNQRKTKND